MIFVEGLRIVFKKVPAYIIAVFAAIVFVTIVVIVTQFQVLRYLFTAPTFTFFDKMNAFFASFGSLQTNFGVVQKIILVLSAILFGITIASVVYYARRQFRTVRSAGYSMVGAIIGILGVGCSACGSVIITAILGTSASVFVARYFPLKGLEFSIIGLVIMVFALRSILDKVVHGGTCAVGDTRR